MVASTNPGWLQTAFDTLTGIFDRVGLNKNVQKTVGMVCHPARRPWYGKMKPIHGGWQVRGGVTRRDSGSGLSTLSAGRTWWGGHWLRNAKPRKYWKRGVQDRRVTYKAGVTSRVPTVCILRQRKGRGTVPLRGVVSGWQHILTCGCNSGIGTSGTWW